MSSLTVCKHCRYYLYNTSIMSCNQSTALLFILAIFVSCNGGNVIEDPRREDFDTTKIQEDTTWARVSMQRSVTGVQPMTGLVLWTDYAEELHSRYGQSISLEYSYCLPCKVVTGKTGNEIQYDWSSFDDMLEGIAARGHQAIVRFRYEYPSGTDVDGQKGTTAVPAYIKALPDYHETYSKNPGGDGPTYYADWSNAELQWFTTQFYTAFNERYGNDSRLAFIEVGFGHWSEYHIYGTDVRLGTNFPSKAYQSEFLQHLAATMTIPWSVSIDAADTDYSPITENSILMNLNFGVFDDSFMHKQHDKVQGEGYNEECWLALDTTRWKRGVCGGEISYYSDKDQRNFLNPNGMYGVTWEAASAKYHITFMIANDAPQTTYGTPERFKEASMECGYHFKVLDCLTNNDETKVLVKNIGIAPLYRDAYFAINNTRSEESLRGLLPGERKLVLIKQPLTNEQDLCIVSDAIGTRQKIEYECNIHAKGTE